MHPSLHVRFLLDAHGGPRFGSQRLEPAPFLVSFSPGPDTNIAARVDALKVLAAHAVAAYLVAVVINERSRRVSSSMHLPTPGGSTPAGHSGLRRIRAGPRQEIWRVPAHRPADPQHVPDATFQTNGVWLREPSRAADRNRVNPPPTRARSGSAAAARASVPLARERTLHSRALARSGHATAGRPESWHNRISSLGFTSMALAV